MDSGQEMPSEGRVWVTCDSCTKPCLQLKTEHHFNEVCLHDRKVKERDWTIYLRGISDEEIEMARERLVKLFEEYKEKS